MRCKEIIIKAFKRELKSERGLRIISPDEGLAGSHILKSDHNLIVMTDLNELGHSDWVVIAAYYSMYHSATSILLRIGLDSKDHVTTVAILEYFFGEKIEKLLLEKFNELKKIARIEEKYIDYLWRTKKTREAMQYGIDIGCNETNMVMHNAREFTTKIKLLLEEIDSNLVDIVAAEAKKIWSYARKVA